MAEADEPMLRFNPLRGNPFGTRTDAQEAARALFQPLLPYFSSGGARVTLGSSAAHYDQAAADLEGFARPLWGLAPLAAGGGHFDHWPLLARGLANGCDPEHPDYWGTVEARDQRMVECAALGFALRLVPDRLWHGQSPAAQRNITAYLVNARNHAFVPNNWMFFRVMIDNALDHLGIPYDRAGTEAYLDQLEGFDIGGGWYRDGLVRRVDHYIPFAMHFYGLIHAVIGAGDDARKARMRARSVPFAADFQHWFDSDGGTIAFGRSMTYRFACAGFWAALAFANEEALPWGVIRGHWARHMRWWSKLPIAEGTGVLSVGYGYANLLMSENYNSPGSPYWAMKALLPLALPETHPFWQAEEAQPAIVPGPHPQPQAGMVLSASPSHVYALSSGQENRDMRFGAEKYAKFAYSSRYAFSVESDERIFDNAAIDSMLAFSDDGRHFRVREANEVAEIAADMLRANWRPYPDVLVETFLVPAGPWHIRLHAVTSPRPLQIAEGGFAVARRDGVPDTCQEQPGLAAVFTQSDGAAIVDTGSGLMRQGVVRKAPPNTNLIHPRTSVPQLRGTLPAGRSLLVTAVIALADADAVRAALRDLPMTPDIDELRSLFAQDGKPVGAIGVAGGPL